jgi:hypothetical protein
MESRLGSAGRDGRPEARDASVPAKAVARWNQSDLIQRVVDALEVARQVVRAIAEIEPGTARATARPEGAGGFLGEKVVAETAMLLLCLESIRSLDNRIREQVDEVAKLLIPHARHQNIRAAICLDPGLARDHAIAHAILSRLGFPDPDVDELLSKSLAMGPDFGPERLPHRRLEQAWLARVWNVVGPPTGRDSQLEADSMLGRPMDVLGATRLDIYAFTHAVMYASDLGGRQLSRNRSLAAVVADADAVLAYCLDSNDFDLTAEVLMIWPMLGLSWSPAATFAFGILANLMDRVGFLPGLTFDLTRYEASKGEERSRYALATSYHATYVMGFLCAVALAQGCIPPAAVPPSSRSRGAGAAFLSLVSTESSTLCWREPFGALANRQQDSVAPLLLTILLRRARTQGNLRLLQDALDVALAYDLIGGPACSQALALLRRIQALRL